MSLNTDGRVARGQRTRAAIVDAHAALLREGTLKPTAVAIAERAGVSVRTLWLNFHDMEALLQATTDWWMQADNALYEPIDPDLPLTVRIDHYCNQRMRRLENIAPAAKSAALGEPFSEALQASHKRHVDRALEQVRAVFERELAANERQKDFLVATIATAASWGSWSFMRFDLGLSATAAHEIMRHQVKATLGVT